MVHVGFYDSSIGDGIYETHLNYFIAAENAKDAKAKAQSLEEFKSKSMHIDGIKEISNVEGYEVILREALIPKKAKFCLMMKLRSFENG